MLICKLLFFEKSVLTVVRVKYVHFLKHLHTCSTPSLFPHLPRKQWRGEFRVREPHWGGEGAGKSKAARLLTGGGEDVLGGWNIGDWSRWRHKLKVMNEMETTVNSINSFEFELIVCFVRR